MLDCDMVGEYPFISEIQSILNLGTIFQEKGLNSSAWYRPPGCPVGSFDRLEKVLAYLDREGKGRK